MKAILIDNETLLRKYKDEAPQILSSEIPAELQKIVFKSLAQSPDHRYKTADEMREDLHRFLHGNRQPVAPEIPPTQAVPIYSKPTADNPVSEVTNIKTPPQTNEAETTVRPVSTPKKSKSKRIYLAISAIIFLYLPIFIGSYWLTNSNDQTLILFREGDKFGFSDSAKNIIIPPKYESAYSFSEGLARVKLNGKCGFVDKTGKEIIPLKYDYAASFSEGLASVKLNDKYGFIDKTGKEIIPLKYEYAFFFSEGLASVKLNGKWFKIDKNGKEYDEP